ncbi:MAG: hypothetical protein WC712_04630 [Candidatus Brocadiia bacterium]
MAGMNGGSPASTPKRRVGDGFIQRKLASLRSHAAFESLGTVVSYGVDQSSFGHLQRRLGKNVEDAKGNYGMWLFCYDPNIDELVMLAGAEGMILHDSVSSEMAAYVAETMRVRYGDGSSGLALERGEGLCLLSTEYDPRGAVAVEDLLIGNLSYAAWPVVLPQSESWQMTAGQCYLGVLLPIRDAWRKLCARGCVLKTLKAVADTEKDSIGMAMQLARISSVNESLSHATDLSACNQSTVWTWIPFLERLFFENCSPHPLGTEATMIISHHDGNEPVVESRFGVRSVGRFQRDRLRQLAVELVVRRSEPESENAWSLEDPGFAQVVAKAGLCKPIVREIRIPDSPLAVRIEVFDTESAGHDERLDRAVEALRSILSNLVLDEVTAIFAPGASIAELPGQRCRSALISLFGDTVSKWLVGESISPTMLAVWRDLCGIRPVATSPTSLGQGKDLVALSDEATGIIAKFLSLMSEVPADRGRLPASVVLWASSSQPIWHMASQDLESKYLEAFVRPPVYQVLRYLANASRDDLSRWEGDAYDDVLCWTGESDDVCVRLSCRNGAKKCLKHCSGIGLEATVWPFETAISCPPADSGGFTPLTAVHRYIDKDGSMRMDFHADGERKLRGLPSQQPSVRTLWKLTKDVFLMGTAVSEKLCRQLERNASALVKAKANDFLPRIRDYYMSNGDKRQWLTYRVLPNIGHPSKCDLLTQVPTQFVDDMKRYGQFLADAEAAPLAVFRPMLITVIPLLDAQHFLHLYSFCPRPRQKESVSSSAGKSVCFDELQETLLAAMVEYIVSFLRSRSAKLRLEEEVENNREARYVKETYLQIIPHLSRLVDYIHSAEHVAVWLQERINPTCHGFLQLTKENELRNAFSEVAGGTHDLQRVLQANTAERILKVKRMVESFRTWANGKDVKDSGKDSGKDKYLIRPLIELWDGDLCCGNAANPDLLSRIFACFKHFIADMPRAEKELSGAQILATLLQVRDLSVSVNGQEWNSGSLEDPLTTPQGLKRFLDDPVLFFGDGDELTHNQVFGYVVNEVPLRVCAALSGLLWGALKKRDRAGGSDAVQIDRALLVIPQHNMKKHEMLLVLDGTGRFLRQSQLLPGNDSSIQDLGSGLQILTKLAGDPPSLINWGVDHDSANDCPPWHRACLGGPLPKVAPGQQPFCVYSFCGADSADEEPVDRTTIVVPITRLTTRSR